jgi:hypothetical protein
MTWSLMSGSSGAAGSTVMAVATSLSWTGARAGAGTDRQDGAGILDGTACARSASWLCLKAGGLFRPVWLVE